MSYTSGSHTVFHRRYHIVWITKYRYKVLEGALRERIRTIIRQLCKELGGPDRLRRFVARTCPYVRGNPAAYCGQRLRAARQGMLIASGADPGLAQVLLGAAFLGSGLLLHHQRQHHGRCHTSVSSEARTYRHQPVVIQLNLNLNIDESSVHQTGAASPRLGVCE
jgi:Transposase IS200 like